MSIYKPNQTFDIDLPAHPDTADPELRKQLLIVYNSIKSLANAVDRRNKLYIIFSSTYELGTLVNIFDVAGVPKVRLANYGGPECHGVVTIRADAGNTGEILLYGLFEFYSFMTSGGSLWASATPGQVTGVNPGAGSQRVGFALSPTKAWFNPTLS